MKSFKQVTMLILFMASLVGVTHSAFPAEICTQTPDNSKIQSMFLTSVSELAKKSKTSLMILPFEDASQLSGQDKALSTAFLVSLYDMLSPLSNVGVFHPMIPLNISQSVPNEKLFDKDTFLAEAKNQKATHLILGQFQKQNGTIRLFVKIINVNTGNPIGPPQEYTLTENERYFSVMADVAADILSITSDKKTKPDIFKEYLLKAPTYEAFRYYVKGLEKSFRYDLVDLEIAKAWFEKSVMISFKFTDALLEKKRILWMQALLSRQMNKDVSLYLSEANAIKATPFILPKNDTASKLTFKRWEQAFRLANESVYLSADQAAIKLKQAHQLTPEDTLITYEYAQRLKQLGQNYSDAWQQASLTNPCLPKP